MASRSILLDHSIFRTVVGTCLSSNCFMPYTAISTTNVFGQADQHEIATHRGNVGSRSRPRTEFSKLLRCYHRLSFNLKRHRYRLSLDRVGVVWSMELSILWSYCLKRQSVDERIGENNLLLILVQNTVLKSVTFSTKISSITICEDFGNFYSAYCAVFIHSTSNTQQSNYRFDAGKYTTKTTTVYRSAVIVFNI